MLAVEPVRRCCGDEELGAVGVRASVGHAEQARLGVKEVEVFVLELETIDALTASAVAVREVAALAHEAWDDAVERGAFVLLQAELPEVLRRLWDDTSVQAEHDASRRLPTNGDVKEDLLRHVLGIRRTAAAAEQETRRQRGAACCAGCLASGLSRTHHGHGGADQTEAEASGTGGTHGHGASIAGCKGLGVSRQHYSHIVVNRSGAQSDAGHEEHWCCAPVQPCKQDCWNTEQQRHRSCRRRHPHC
mmetsp:Transcript_13517/g.37119  ORF Transcript_13517/g.37119 Transcript_13517/m.37119 type:complete len:247 (-) Transcript_13517:46-786(-)